ncbi:hypothetical protein [Rhizobium leguminosarum]|uniref:hypothetical protein n=1 Tax=Rhizobium leguminosarum TaxID=384 RepID=UPI0010313FD2|nr:hypothetical protein [Rhizobium leguminosarum]TAV90453.1 hypothetical protein ELI22_15015 [Rhizobium leguminosarum]TAV95058.1 hypothetical protein ELI21_15170 [Rhizobium leguminosarum]TAW36136.1 hypothetical protein ELI23_15215 [Rhizobium leguminosarum]
MTRLPDVTPLLGIVSGARRESFFVHCHDRLRRATPSMGFRIPLERARVASCVRMSLVHRTPVGGRPFPICDTCQTDIGMGHSEVPFDTV